MRRSVLISIAIVAITSVLALVPNWKAPHKTIAFGKCTQCSDLSKREQREMVRVVSADQRVRFRLRFTNWENLQADIKPHTEGVWEVHLYEDGNGVLAVSVFQNPKIEIDDIKGSRGFDKDRAKYGGSLASKWWFISATTVGMIGFLWMGGWLTGSRLITITLLAMWALPLIAFFKVKDAWMPMSTFIVCATAVVAWLAWFRIPQHSSNERNSESSARLRSSRAALPILIVITLALFGGRYWATMETGSIIDVGIATYAGAEIMAHDVAPWGLLGQQPQFQHGDTYGPIAYVSYIPAYLLEKALNSTSAEIRPNQAMQIAAIMFDFVCALLLFFWVRKIWDVRRALCAASAWALMPASLITLSNATNDGVLAFFIMLAAITSGHPTARGAFATLAAGVKFAPLAVLSVLLVRNRQAESGRLREAALTLAGVAVVTLGMLAYLVRYKGALQDFWNSAIKFQLERDQVGSGSVWIWYHIEWLQIALGVVFLALLVASFVWPRRSTSDTIVTGMVAILATVVAINTNFWFNYLMWFAPLLLISTVNRRATDTSTVSVAD